MIFFIIYSTLYHNESGDLTHQTNETNIRNSTNKSSILRIGWNRICSLTGNRPLDKYWKSSTSTSQLILKESDRVIRSCIYRGSNKEDQLKKVSEKLDNFLHLLFRSKTTDGRSRDFLKEFLAEVIQIMGWLDEIVVMALNTLKDFNLTVGLLEDLSKSIYYRMRLTVSNVPKIYESLKILLSDIKLFHQLAGSTESQEGEEEKCRDERCSQRILISKYSLPILKWWTGRITEFLPPILTCNPFWGNISRKHNGSIKNN